MTDLVTIYSGEHGAYWGDNGGGYTSAQYAGVYTREDAIRRTSHCGPEKRIKIETVPEDHVPTLKARLAELTVPAAKWNAAMREAARMNVTCLDTAKGAILSLVQQLEAAREQLRQIEACVENDDCPDLPLVTRVASVVANLQTMIGKWHKAKEERDEEKARTARLRQALLLARDVSVSVRNGTAKAMAITPDEFIAKLNSALQADCEYCAGTGTAISTDEEGDEWAMRCNHPTAHQEPEGDDNGLAR